MQTYLNYLSNSLGKWHRRIHRVRYYSSRAYLNLPHKFIEKSLNKVLSEYNSLDKDIKQNINNRVDYYNKLNCNTEIITQPIRANLAFIGKFKNQGSSTYFYDIAEYLRFFQQNTPFVYAFGDVQYIPEQPSLVKSRPIAENNQNSVILKLDSIRHFYTVKDPFNFADKKPLIVWRGAAHQPHRKAFLEKYYNHHLCDVKCVHKNSLTTPYHGDFMSIKNQLRYKYILSIEGNDVATNLKWIMASNSLVFMTKPKFETWLMEGLLKPDVHFVQLKDDYSDLEEKIDYYNKQPKEAEKIIQNAQNWMRQFFDEKQELITSLLVMKKYFELVKIKVK